MATVVSFINFKGGVGKTTLSVELAASLYKKFNSRVLMVDLDPQSNCTLYWLNEADWERQINEKGTLLSFFEACLDDKPFDISSIIATPTRFAKSPWYQQFDLRLNRGIKLVPSDMQLFGVDLRLAQRFGFENPKAQLFLKKALAAIDNQYDFIFIDCPPNLYLATQNGLFASQYYVVVALAEYLSTLGIAHIQASINSVFSSANNIIGTEAFKKPSLAGIVFNKVRYLSGGTQSQEDFMSRIRAKYPESVFKSYVSQSDKIAQRPAQSEPIALSDYAVDQKYADQIHTVAEEFYDRITRP
ncbi:ParA family protein [Thauera sp. Sel9]|uniref:ParA family protein n=1 Tax=Thauera sp. Sel9 TaxID=2974299 RepID=UPI0021E16A34|nr:AAA family ATPase [Thauera sp. Sel9]MCV2219902.1 AAA family ATPase [Thauera sp. Sel9]